MPSKTKPKSSRKDINAEITQKFIDTIESGVSPFKVPWSSSYGMPRNFAGRQYRGINFFLTLLHCDEFGWDIPVFMTFKQAKEHGFKIRKGEKSVPVIFSNVRVPKEYRDDPDSCPTEKRTD
ncbi:protein of unknown function [Rubritalea squalenifaciens DSM 18772]|uniref:N-terminal domain-containing protein n=1 Tax=Rubritalea squalenifaciens DSM 18772 TaxID=1123071 RepID=A0A1M6GPC4_9BACT|nr:ArdC family protein [Rubritalea squalenifaciens]SHJ11807.1 protein of unknown function [Rubritalea squalenifaciens DSM 18772]